MLNIVYTGSIDASVEQIKKVIILAHSLGIPVPVSEQLSSVLGMDMSSLIIRQPHIQQMMVASTLGGAAIVGPGMGVGAAPVNQNFTNNANEQGSHLVSLFQKENLEISSFSLK